jgi:protein-S-isoprenylcysteine O-methyltransferase Ste14
MNLQEPQVTFLVGLFAYLTIRGIYQRKASAAGPFRSDRSTPKDKALIFLVLIGQLILPLAYVLTPVLNLASYPPISAAIYPGALLWAIGIWLFWRSHADLGNNWSVSLEVQHNHQLIQRGVYRVLRHPMYASFLLLGLAQAVLLPNAIAGASAFLAVVVLCIVRVPSEEAMLCEVFGQKYIHYMKTTGGVIPFIFRRNIARIDG